MVELHEGTIGCSSKLSQGSEFFFTVASDVIVHGADAYREVEDPVISQVPPVPAPRAPIGCVDSTKTSVARRPIVIRAASAARTMPSKNHVTHSDSTSSSSDGLSSELGTEPSQAATDCALRETSTDESKQAFDADRPRRVLFHTYSHVVTDVPTAVSGDQGSCSSAAASGILADRSNEWSTVSPRFSTVQTEMLAQWQPDSVSQISTAQSVCAPSAAQPARLPRKRDDGSSFAMIQLELYSGPFAARDVPPVSAPHRMSRTRYSRAPATARPAPDDESPGGSSSVDHRQRASPALWLSPRRARKQVALDLQRVSPRASVRSLASNSSADTSRMSAVSFSNADISPTHRASRGTQLSMGHYLQPPSRGASPRGSMHVSALSRRDSSPHAPLMTSVAFDDTKPVDVHDVVMDDSQVSVSATSSVLQVTESPAPGCNSVLSTLIESKDPAEKTNPQRLSIAVNDQPMLGMMQASAAAAAAAVTAVRAGSPGPASSTASSPTLVPSQSPSPAPTRPKLRVLLAEDHGATHRWQPFPENHGKIRKTLRPVDTAEF